MPDHIDYFSDLLEPNEQISSTLAGPGPDDGGTPVWYQIAATQTRLLVVELHANTSGSWLPAHRIAANLADINMSRHERSDNRAARLEISGFNRPVTVVDIDQPSVFPMVEPLIVAWGGRLGGTGTQRPEPKPTPHMSDENRRWAIVGLGCVGLMIAGCASAGCLGAILTTVLELK